MFLGLLLQTDSLQNMLAVAWDARPTLTPVSTDGPRSRQSPRAASMQGRAKPAAAFAFCAGLRARARSRVSPSTPAHGSVGCGCVGAWAADAWAAPPTHTTNALPFDEAAVADEALPGLRVVRCQAHSIRYCASTCAASAASHWTTGAVELWSCGAAVAVVSCRLSVCGCVQSCSLSVLRSSPTARGKCHSQSAG